MTSNARPDNKRARTAAVIIPFAALAMPYSLISVLLGDIVTEFHLTGSSQGLMRSMISGGSLAALMFLILIRLKVRKTCIVLFACIVAAVSLVAVYASKEIIVLSLSFLLLGIGIGGYESMATSLLVDLHGNNSLKYISLFHGVFCMVSISLPYIVQGLRNVLTWREIYLIAAAVMVIAAVQLGAVWRSGLSENGETVAVERLRFEDYKSYVLSKWNLLLLAGLSCFVFMHTSIVLWVIRYFEVELAQPGLGAIAFSAYWAFAMLSRFIIPHIKLKLGKAILAGAMISGVAIMTSLYVKSGIAVCISLALIGILCGHAPSTLVAVAARSYHGRSEIPSQVTITVQYATMILAPLIIGMLVKEASLKVAMSMIGVSIIMGGLLIKIRQKREESQK